jgi:HSP20 family protein
LTTTADEFEEDLRDGDIEASLAHGVLTVYVPKVESTKSSKITVSESGDGSP